jgi:Phage XkdN-like protein.
MKDTLKIYDPLEDNEPLSGEDMLEMEPDLLRALSISDSAEVSQTIVVKNPLLGLNGKPKNHESDPSFPVFKFDIVPLPESAFNRCHNACTKYIRVKKAGGMKVPEDVDSVRYRSMIIYAATVPDANGVKLWDKPELRERYPKVLDKYDMVDTLIKWAGVKSAIFERIQEISGYNDENTEESLKN